MKIQKQFDKYTFIWMGKNKESESIPCSTENQRGPGLSVLCTVFSFARLQFVLASVKSVQDICIYIHIVNVFELKEHIIINCIIHKVSIKIFYFAFALIIFKNIFIENIRIIHYFIFIIIHAKFTSFFKIIKLGFQVKTRMGARLSVIN